MYIKITVTMVLLSACIYTSRARANEPLFSGSDTCLACHNGLTNAAGEDVSFGFNWRPSMMANAARDPYWQASVRREAIDHPTVAAEIEDECAACHMPMTRFQAKTAGAKGAVFANLAKGDSAPDDALLAADGVSCTVCHQIASSQLGAPESFNGGFVVDTAKPWEKRSIFGPFAVQKGLTRIMRSASAFQPMKSPHIQRSEVCAACHTLFTQAFGPKGEVVGRLAEQVPYLEWKHSEYADQMSCQSCHMPVESEPTPISNVLGQPRPALARHVFQGGNFLMPRILNRYRIACDVHALPQELDGAAIRAAEHLKSAAATVSIAGLKLVGDALVAEITVSNLAGHKLPTAYPSRRVWLHVTVTDDRGAVLLESGALNANGSIFGNDNDSDARRVEPHYTVIDTRDKVQIYESIMVNRAGAVTTALLSGVRYIKDNRILPIGFDKKSANGDIAPQGDAIKDDTFTGGSHRVLYRAKVSGQPRDIRVTAELMYQPIGFRWAMNLQSVQAAEAKRFVGYFRSMEKSSALVLTQATAEWTAQSEVDTTPIATANHTHR